METNSDYNYRRILKGTAVFGGVQFIQILINILKGKAVSVLIGAVGMGLYSMFMSAMEVVVTLSGMGLKTSGVRDIADARAKNDKPLIGYKISVLDKSFVFTCMVGFVITLILSPFLSKISFDNYDHLFEFCILALFVVFTILADRCLTILQGLHMVKETAACTLWSCMVSFLLSVALYYFWGVKGIVFNIVLTAMATFLIRAIYVRKLHIVKTTVPIRMAIRESRFSFVLGFAMVLSTLIGNIVTLLINSFIYTHGNVSDVGFFQAATAITSQSVALIFASLAADYYPRLIMSISNKDDVGELVNQQGEIVCLIALPVLVLLIIVAHYAVVILYTEEFEVIVPLIRCMCLGVLLQAITFSFGYVSFAKGDKKAFFLVEGVYANLCRGGLYVLGYYYYGLYGIGYAFVLSNVLYFFVIVTLVNKRYSIVLRRTFLRIILISVSVCLISMYCMTIQRTVWLYILSAFVFIVSVCFSFSELNRRVPVRTFLRINKR